MAPSVDRQKIELLNVRIYVPMMFCSKELFSVWLQDKNKQLSRFLIAPKEI
jgi:hypothetical protein